MTRRFAYGASPVVEGVGVNEHRHKQHLGEEVERVESHDAAHDELRRGLDAGRRLVLAQLRGGVRRHAGPGTDGRGWLNAHRQSAVSVLGSNRTLVEFLEFK